MEDDTTGKTGSTDQPRPTQPGAAGKPEEAPIEVTPTTTAADLLAALERQGISDLETFVDKLVAEAKEKFEEEHGEDDDDTLRINVLVHDHYGFVYFGHQTETHQ